MYLPQEHTFLKGVVQCFLHKASKQPSSATNSKGNVNCLEQTATSEESISTKTNNI